MKFHQSKISHSVIKGATAWHKAAVVAVGLTAFGGALAAGTTAGQTIQNTALASYEDANGNVFESTSNTSTIKVAEVYAASVEFDRDVVGSPGSVVYFPHVVRNNGNGTDIYTLTVAQGNTQETAAGAAAANCSSVEVFEDQNGNGVADSGEPIIGSGGTVSIDADRSIDVVVSCQIAGTTAPGSVIGLTLSVEASRDGINTAVDGDASNDVLDALATIGASVADLTASKGDDTLDGTNEDTVTVSGDAVISVTKQATYSDNGTPNTLADDTVEYYMVIRNNGISPAYNVEISDVIDLTTHDVSDVTDITGLTVTGAFVDGAAASEGTSADWTAGLCEVLANGTGCVVTAAGVQGAKVIATNDANGDGTTGDFGVRGHDDVLPPNTTLTVRFTVPVLATLAAGADIDNTISVKADVDDDGDATDPVSEILTADATTEVPSVYGVTASDTGLAKGDAATDALDLTDGVTNDGGDDDKTINDIQTVDSVPSGAIVKFDNIITNNGNVVDTFELTINSADYPAGTVFTLYDSTNTALLSDSNLNGDVDTGPLAPGASLSIVVRANLPDGFSDNTTAPFDAVLTATSNGATLDGITPAIADTKTERLNNILAPAVDLANAAADNDINADQHNYVQGTNTAITVVETLPGTIATFNLTVQNDSGSPDSFDLFSGGSYVTAGNVLGALPTGWTVVFRNASNSVVTSSSTIAPGGSESFTAQVSVPSNVALALANNAPGLDVDDLDGDTNQTTGRDLVDFNTDGDNDYAIFFLARSSNSGSYDVKLDGVDVAEQEDVTLVSDNTGQVAAGGSIDYPHTLRNEGNTVETIILSSLNSDADWGNGLVVDTTGNGVPNAIANATVTQVYIDHDNNPVTAPQLRAVTVDANGNITIVLNPNETLPFNDRVFAPSDAAANEPNTTTITATYDAGADTLTNDDLTKVVPGQLRLRKFAALDAACDTTPDSPFVVNSGSDVEPGQCVCWLIVATNTGSSLVDNVIINDSAPTFTTYQANSISSCAGDESSDVGGTPCAAGLVANTDAADTVQNAEGYYGYHDGAGNVRLEVGALGGGDAASMQFCTQVQ